MTLCARCGHELGIGRFCTNCGHRIGEPVPAEARPTAPVPSPGAAPGLPVGTLALGALLTLVLLVVLVACLG